MSSSVYLLVSLLFSVTVSYEAARILAMYPTPSFSHHLVFRPLMQELAKRGHEVVVITPDPAFPKGQTPANLTEIDVHDMSYGMWRQKYLPTATGKKDDIITQMKVAESIMNVIFEKQVENEEVQKILRDKNKGFDLVMVEAWVRPLLGLSHVYKVPLIQVSSMGPNIRNREAIGAPTHPLLYPVYIRQKLNNLTLWEQIKELNLFVNMKKILDPCEEENKTLKKLFGPETPTLMELNNNVEMIFLNNNPIFEGNHPVPPSLIHMGGMHQTSQKELPNELKTFLDFSVHGVIYISFGSNTNPSMLPPEKMQTFLRVFSKLPYDILWKWDKDELPGKSKNIKIGKWFPQSDLLRHKKIKLFVTQGGQQSTHEAITAGVPLIGIPLKIDQWYNVEKYVQHKIGVRLDLTTLTEEKFETAVKTVIGDESYRDNIVNLRTLMADQPQQPFEHAVWWIEHVIRHGSARHLRAPAANMSWREYFELELTLTCLLFLLVFLLISLYTPYFLIKYALSNYRNQNVLRMF